MQISRSTGTALLFVAGAIPLAAAAAEGRRQIEEVVVTAEKVESTVSDTSISITAFDSEMLQDFGIQSADEMVNFIPATTRDDYDVRIRGVGRNFRALGGDPGVATYYNGIYSPDFGIAASENALYDVERVEVLRGPQGTLYGRNSVGGAINYVTKRPTMEPEGEIRTQVGQFNTREFYGMVSGPIIKDRLAARVTGVKRDRDGSQEGIGDTDDLNSIDDQNLSLALEWQVTDNITWYVRGNDRESDRLLGTGMFIDEGAAPIRGTRSNQIPVFGMSTRGGTVTASTPGAMSFTNPVSNQVIWATYARPGLDPIGWPHQPNAAFGRSLGDLVSAGHDLDNPGDRVSANQGPGGCHQHPYTTCESNHEYFGHQSGSSEITWEINEQNSLRYLYGYQSFTYTYNRDLDWTDSDFSKYRDTVDESVWSYSHELQYNWSIGERWTATTGAYSFKEQRNQDYSLSNRTARYTQPANYGALDTKVAFLGNKSITDLYFGGAVPNGGHARLYSAAVGTSNYGRWLGDPRGDVYEHENQVDNEALAFYTQGTIKFNDQWSLVLGVRYAKDEKSAEEVRGGYYEDSLPWAMGFIGFIPGATFPTNGLTQSGAINVSMGNATKTNDPANPMVANCELTATQCATPLRLGPGLPASFSSHVAGDDSWDDVNYRINVDWTPNDDILVYASYTTGYRSGGYQLGVTDARDQQRDANGLPVPGAAIDPMTYDQETIDAIEIGYKGFHLDKSLQISASIYQYSYDGYQDRIDAFDPVRGRSVDVVQNAEGAVNRGFEIETLWLPTDQLTLGLNYSYTDAFYDEDYFLVDTANPEYPLSLFGPVNAANPNNAFLIHNVKDEQLKGIPEHKATAWAVYDIPTAYGNFNLRATYAYTGEYSQRGIDSEYDLLPERDVINLSAGWTDPEQRWDVRLFVDNVTDDMAPRNVSIGTESSNWQVIGSALYPRYWGLDVTYRFWN